MDTLRIRLGASIPQEFARRFGRSYRPGNRMTYARAPEARLQARYALPTTESWRKGFFRQLSPGPFVESDDPVIAERATRIAGTETDPTTVARRIVGWVSDSMAAKTPAHPLSAAGAMTERSGDAREFSLLTTALLRAAGIPAYPVTGLLQHGGRFYMHAWTEVFVGRWIPVDAMLDQFPADASHIAFLAGAADPGPDLARILGRLEMKVVGAVRSP
jgi:transglutaminase-like putative cysteine protease